MSGSDAGTEVGEQPDELEIAHIAVPPPRERVIEERREWARIALAFSFVLIFASTILFGFGHLGKGDWAQAKDLIQLLLPAETALLGSAVGFYFGTRR